MGNKQIKELEKKFENLCDLNSAFITNTYLEENFINFINILINLQETQYTKEETKLLLKILGQLAFYTNETFNFKLLIDLKLFQKLSLIIDYFLKFDNVYTKNDNNKQSLVYIYESNIITLLGNLASTSEEISIENFKYNFINIVLHYLDNCDIFIADINLIQNELFSLFQTFINYICKNSKWLVNVDKFINLQAHNILHKVFKKLDKLIKRNSNDTNLIKNLNIVKTTIITTFYNILDEDMMHEVNITDDVIATLVHVIKQAIEQSKLNTIKVNESRYYITYGINNNHHMSVSNALELLTRISVDDQTKKNLYTIGVLPLISQLIDDANMYEQECCIELLASLCFDNNIRQSIYNNSFNLLEKIKNLKTNNINKLCEQIMRMVENRTDELTITKNVGYVATWLDKLNIEKNIATQTTTNNHIMISYCHADSKICKKINEALKRNNYIVWFDKEQNFTNIFDAMAEAIQDASIILLCYSSFYKESSSCRYEGEYAAKLNKPIIPIRTQKAYKPDGNLFF